MKKIGAILVCIWCMALPAFAFTGDIEVSQDSVGLHDTFQVILSIQANLEEDIKTYDLAGLENFTQIGMAQQQNIADKVISVNGKVESQRIIHYVLSYVLRPKEEGDFVIGPLSISDGVHTETTKSITIHVQKDNVVGQTTTPKTYQLSQSKNQSHVQKYMPSATMGSDESVKKIPSIFTTDQQQLFFISIILAIFIAIIIAILLARNDRKKSENLSEKSQVGEAQTDISTPQGVSGNLVLPDTDDEYFTSQLERYITEKLRREYLLPEEESLYDFLKSEHIPPNKQEILKKLVNTLYALKYSQVVVDRGELLELAKKL